MPFPLQALILWLHLLAAMTWIGGLVFQVLVVFPTLAWAAPTGERLRFALSLEARFRVLWPAVWPGPVYRPGESHEHLVCHRRARREHLAHVCDSMSVKLGLVVGMIAVQAVQQLLIYPRRIAALSSVSAGVQDVPLAFRTWQRWALVAVWRAAWFGRGDSVLRRALAP